MDEFIQAIIDSGLKPPSDIVIDGTIHRFASSNKIRNKDGYYALFDNGDGFIGGFFGCWRMGIKQNWFNNKSNEINNEVERKVLQKKISEKRIQCENKRLKQNEKAVKKARAIWEAALPAPDDHPYLKRKSISGKGLRVNSKNFLLVPVLDCDGNIRSLQFINPKPKTRKNFLTGGRIKGNFFKIEGNDETAFLVEGYATGWSIHKATGACVYIAFSAGNLSDMAENLITLNLHKKIIIAADNDTNTKGNPGKTFAEEAAKKYNLPIIWPEFNASQLDLEPSDFNDLHIICGLDAVKSRLDEATLINNESETNNKTKQTKKTQAELLLEITKKLYFFENQEGEIFVDLTTGNHKETWPSQSKTFQRWLTAKYYDRYQKAPSRQAINDSIHGIEAIAISNRNKHQTHIRLAKDENCIYLDLCNDDWEVVKIDKQGWKVIKDSPIKFIRTNVMQSLPYPNKSCEISALWKLIPVKNQNDRILILGWLLQLLNPDGPYPLIVLEGPQGSGKSRTTIVLKSLADPSLAMIRTIPSTEKDLFISAKNSLVIAYDNISNMTNWLSDALCRISTGGSFSTRKLFTDTEETILSVKKPIIINGINQVIDRPGLAHQNMSCHKL